MTSVLLRALLLFALFGAAWPPAETGKQTDHAVQPAPTQVLPGGETRQQLKLELPGALAASTGAWRVRVRYERAVEPHPPRACAFLKAKTSRARLPRRRVPRMRDDLGDP